MTGFLFAMRMAARELRAAPRRMALLVGTVAVGVAALVAINSFTDNLQESVQQQARGILGADLSLSSRQPFSRRTEAAVDSLSRRAELARITSFAAMAYVPRTAGTRLVQVAAVQGDYPFYGQIGTEPREAWRRLQTGRHVIVDPSLLSALDANIGDTLALGEARFGIIGTITATASEAGFRFALGPRIYIPARHLHDTGLLGFGARVQYEVFVKLPAGSSAQQLAARYRQQLAPDRIRVRTVADDQRNLNQSLSRLAGYLGLVALMALLLGGIGVASAAVVLVRQRSDSIAVLRCLGATSRRTFAVYLIEAAAMGLAGSALGALGGLALQRLLPGLLAPLLPVTITPSLSGQAVTLGVGIGLWVTLVFSLLPLLGVRRISPLQALRRPYQPEQPWRDAWWGVALLAMATTTLLLTVHQVGSWRQGTIFAGWIAGTLLVLWGVAGLLTRILRRRTVGTWAYVWRQGLANLHRPANQTATLILAIGFAAFLLATLYLVQHNLLRQLSETGGPARPNLVMFDIQPDQLSGVREQLGRAGLPMVGPTPIVPMRIQSINGRSISSLLTRDSLRGEERSSAWALRREYRSTYRDSIAPTERVTAGSWRSPQRSPVRISLEQELAQELGVGVGDEIVWDIQGVSLASRIGSLRQVDWARFEPNFFVVFPSGALERAPQSLVLLTRIANPADRGRFQRGIAEQFPNVSTLDLSLLQESLERLVGRVALAVRFMAFFSLGVGVLVLIAALATSRFQRIREGALLRTLGATRSQLYQIILAEYASLGVLASAVAGVLALGASWGLARFVFESRFTVPLIPLAGLGLAIVALTVAVGLANSRDVVQRAPLEVLRDE